MFLFRENGHAIAQTLGAHALRPDRDRERFVWVEDPPRTRSQVEAASLYERFATGQTARRFPEFISVEYSELCTDVPLDHSEHVARWKSHHHGGAKSREGLMSFLTDVFSRQF